MINLKAGQPVKNFIQLAYHANRPPLISGLHGIGKSELFEQAAQELNIDIIIRDLSLMEPPDLIGMPKLSGNTTKYLPPAFLPTKGKGILLFEELNRAPLYMRAPCLQLLTARTLNDYKLPSGWLPAAAINPPDRDYDVEDLDPALLSRFTRVTIVADRDEWLAWARRERIHQAVIDYAADDPTIFDAPESNPRAWKYVSDILKTAESTPTTPPILQAAVVGIVGDKRAAAFLRTMKAPYRSLKACDILAEYRHHRAEVQEWSKTGKLDLIERTLLEVEKHLQANRDYDAVKSDDKKWRNLGQFLHDLPGDLHDQAEEFFTEHEYDFPQRSRKRK